MKHSMTKAYFPNLKPGYSFLFITREEWKKLIIEADWPIGIKITDNFIFYTISNKHILFEEMSSKYSTPEAYRAIQYESYLSEVWLGHFLNQNNPKYEHPSFIEPEDRIYFYIVDPDKAAANDCFYDRHHLQWYLPIQHTNAPKLIKEYTSKKAMDEWLEHRIDIAKKNDLKRMPISSLDDYGYPPAEFITNRGPKRCGNKPDPRMTLRMFEARVAKGIITPKTKKQDATNLIAKDLSMLGIHITPSMVMKQLEMAKGTYKTIIQKYYPDSWE